MDPQHCIRVVLIDDHALVRDGIRALLMAVPELDVVGEAGGGAEAISFFLHAPVANARVRAIAIPSNPYAVFFIVSSNQISGIRSS